MSRKIAQALAELHFDEVVGKVDRALSEGLNPMSILNECRAGMDRVGELYSSGEYFLSELLMSANIFKQVMAKLEPLLMEDQQIASLGPVVIATPIDLRRLVQIEHPSQRVRYELQEIGKPDLADVLAPWLE